MDQRFGQIGKAILPIRFVDSELVRLQILLLDIGQISIGADVTTGNGGFRRQRLVDFSRPRSNALSTGGIDNQVMVFLKPEEAIAR